MSASIRVTWFYIALCSQLTIAPWLHKTKDLRSTLARSKILIQILSLSLSLSLEESQTPFCSSRSLYCIIHLCSHAMSRRSFSQGCPDDFFYLTFTKLIFMTANLYLDSQYLILACQFQPGSYCTTASYININIYSYYPTYLNFEPVTTKHFNMDNHTTQLAICSRLHTFCDTFGFLLQSFQLFSFHTTSPFTTRPSFPFFLPFLE